MPARANTGFRKGPRLSGEFLLLRLGRAVDFRLNAFWLWRLPAGNFLARIALVTSQNVQLSGR